MAIFLQEHCKNITPTFLQNSRPKLFNLMNILWDSLTRQRVSLQGFLAKSLWLRLRSCCSIAHLRYATA